jgi:predicted site-specific integrase-resolvase
MGEILTAEELAARLKVRPATIREWGRDGRIPTVRITPKVIRYDVDAVMRSLQEQQETRK